MGLNKNFGDVGSDSSDTDSQDIAGRAFNRHVGDFEGDDGISIPVSSDDVLEGYTLGDTIIIEWYYRPRGTQDGLFLRFNNDTTTDEYQAVDESGTETTNDRIPIMSPSNTFCPANGQIRIGNVFDYAVSFETEVRLSRGSTDSVGGAWPRTVDNPRLNSIQLQAEGGTDTDKTVKARVFYRQEG
jgi:hypothetical protein